MEHWEELCPGGYRFAYDDTLFRPGTDTFLLSGQPRLKSGMQICDLGSGTGLLGLILLQRNTDVFVTGVEIQEDAVRLAEQVACVNGLEKRLVFRQGDLREIQAILPAGRFDLVVCNPPYYPLNGGRLPADAPRRTARSESSCTLKEVCRAAAWCLRWGGRFSLCHKPERLTDALCTLRQTGLEPKRLRFACKRPDSAPFLLLLEASRVIPPTYLYKLYHRTNVSFQSQYSQISLYG